MRPIALSILLAVLVYAAFAVFADAQALGESLASVALAPVGIALALSSVNYAVRFGRWALYLRRLEVRVPVGASARIFTAGLLMSITPGKLGEAWKSLLLKESFGTPVSRTAGIVIAERLTDLLALLLLLALAAWEALDPRLGLITLALAFGLWSFFAFPALSRPFVSGLQRFGRQELARRVGRFVSSTSELMSPSLLVQGSLIACVGWSLEAYAMTVLAAGIGLDLDAADAFFIYTTSTIVGGLAMIPGGLGVTEGSMTALLARALPHSTSPERVAITLLSRFTTLWWGVVLGLLAHGARSRRTRVEP
jgi:glycosyltransferase 2 family protein